MKTFFQVKTAKLDRMAKTALEDKAAKADLEEALVWTQTWIFPILDNHEGMLTINIKKNNTIKKDK